VTLSLEIVEGLGAGRRVELNAPVQIGRGPEAAIRLDDQHTSRSHASVVPDGTGAVVTDLGSGNGTFVNGHQLVGPVRLLPGDHLLVGSTVLELRTDAQVAMRPSAVIPVPPALAGAPRTPDDVLHTPLEGPAQRVAPTTALGVFVLVVLALLLFLAIR
jgi:pSer/pThr/pTyr-binding forkhead associated (FHA) protein